MDRTRLAALSLFTMCVVSTTKKAGWLLADHWFELAMILLALAMGVLIALSIRTDWSHWY